MGTMRSWRQKNWVAIGVGTIVFVIVIVLIIAGYQNNWTGFNGYNKVTITHAISGTNAGTTTVTEEYQPGKTLWDWLQLLFIPGILTLGAVWFTARQSHDLQIAERQRGAERELAVDKYQEEALETYLDKMSDLLLKEGLRESGEGSELRTIARVRTLTVLYKLDPIRKRTVLKFLFESALIDNNKPIVDLSYADLKEADLQGATLYHCNLEYTNLSNANLEKADLTGTTLARANMHSALLREANLEKVNLSGAIVTAEQLATAKSLKGATMPDGSIHP